MKKNVLNSNSDGDVLIFKEIRRHIDDPLEELINEFSHLIDEEENKALHLEKKLSPDIMSQLEKNRQIENSLDAIFEHLKILEESSLKLKYYLDEIEIFFPIKE